MKIKMSVLSAIVIIAVVAALVYATMQNSKTEDHSQHENMPSAADQMEQNKR